MKRFFIIALVGFSACVVPDDSPVGVDGGKICYSDSDCAPNGCCGNATGAVHVSDAPDCSAVQCTGSCPKNSIDCGCGIAVCKDQQCTTARTTGPGCP